MAARRTVRRLVLRAVANGADSGRPDHLPGACFMPRKKDHPLFTTRLVQARVESYGEGGIPRLAQDLGIPARTWENYEVGVSIPGSILLEFLCLTRVDPRWLAWGGMLNSRCLARDGQDGPDVEAHHEPEAGL